MSKRILIFIVVFVAVVAFSKGNVDPALLGRGVLLERDEFGRILGKCRDRKKCQEICPGEFNPKVVWNCMKLEWCIIDQPKGSMCEYAYRGFGYFDLCGSRRLEQVALENDDEKSNEFSLESSIQVSDDAEDSSIRRDTAAGLNVQGLHLCDFEPEKCAGACNRLGHCLRKTALAGLCRVKDLENQGDYYVGCKNCELDECKRRCYKDFGCQGLEYREYDKVCEIHRRKPTLAFLKKGALCFRKPDKKSQRTESCFRKQPALVAKGYCRDEKNSQGLYTIYKNLQNDRLWLLSNCYKLCQNTPGCKGFEIYSFNCEIHFSAISSQFTLQVSSKKNPECYTMK